MGIQKLKISKRGLELIEFFEGKKYKPYLCGANYVTCGIGHIITDPTTNKKLKGTEGLLIANRLFPKGASDEQINLWLKEDLSESEKLVNKLIKVQLNQDQFDALVSHTFNCGVSETLYKLINTMPLNSESIAIWWRTKYLTANGIKQNGLVKRRSVEYELFNTGKLNLK